jgi:hypothetical protein
VYPNLEGARKDIWDCPDIDGRKGTRPGSVGQNIAKSTLKQQDATREAETPPTRAALDRRTQRHFIQMVTNSIQHPCQDYIEGWDQPDNDAMEMDS